MENWIEEKKQSMNMLKRTSHQACFFVENDGVHLINHLIKEWENKIFPGKSNIYFFGNCHFRLSNDGKNGIYETF
ncbi:hypothetical protein KEH51_14200 [[Brevibacterium] frigoritolerans]|uniref:Uncharacterized protein n=1 Tax=Peribacillus frigoritolerans TaxID=450367 RepID=A0A941J5H9_9BACI|nr:hypothetical protein [Peribacillus frigoritolerans]